MATEARAGGFRLHPVLSILVLAVVALVSLTAAERAAAKPTCQGQKATIKGTPDGETIKGTDEADVIRARAGNDTILGLGGNDVVCSGKGADNANGAEGNDSINGGAGNDDIGGGNGDDRLVTHTGSNLATGGAGVDECRADKHRECEADLRVNVTGPDRVTHGSDETFTFNLNVRNNGPTDAVSPRVDVDLPDPPPEPVRQRITLDTLGSVEYVPEESDDRCVQQDEDSIRCVFGGLPVGNEHSAAIALRFPDCVPERAPRRGGKALREEAVTGRVTDAGTADHVGNNDADTHTFGYDPHDSCFP
ncbi:MAG TPA: hypothetical protein VHF58_03600 [Solirubrobacterales bacterium]|nr:hypothetical protein [Solirubrobacterales bacterium]